MSEIIMYNTERINCYCLSKIIITVENERDLLRRMLGIATGLTDCWEGNSEREAESNMYESMMEMEFLLKKMEDWSKAVEKKLAAFEEIDSSSANAIKSVTF